LGVIDPGESDIAEETAMRLQGKAAPITGGSNVELARARPSAAAGVVRAGRLFVLEMSGERIHSMNPDG
jgi:hypothetical protein